MARLAEQDDPAIGETLEGVSEGFFFRLGQRPRFSCAPLGLFDLLVSVARRLGIPSLGADQGHEHDLVECLVIEAVLAGLRQR